MGWPRRWGPEQGAPLIRPSPHQIVHRSMGHVPRGTPRLGFACPSACPVRLGFACPSAWVAWPRRLGPAVSAPPSWNAWARAPRVGGVAFVSQDAWPGDNTSGGGTGGSRVEDRQKCANCGGRGIYCCSEGTGTPRYSPRIARPLIGGGTQLPGTPPASTTRVSACAPYTHILP